MSRRKPRVSYNSRHVSQKYHGTHKDCYNDICQNEIRRDSTNCKFERNFRREGDGSEYVGKYGAENYADHCCDNERICVGKNFFGHDRNLLEMQVLFAKLDSGFSTRCLGSVSPFSSVVEHLSCKEKVVGSIPTRDTFWLRD